MNVEQVLRKLYPPGTVERPTRRTSPHRRLWQMIFEDKGDLSLILVYTFFSGLFALAIPLATQIVVNTIAAGVFLQPLSVIAGGVLLALSFVAALRLLTFWIVEKIRQRTFARVALRLAYRVPRIKHPSLSKEYLPELVNRFFDTITVQSGWFNFLLDAPAAALQVLVGLVVLAFYSPWLLLFDIIVILFFLLQVFVFGYGGFQTRSDETTQRFLIAEWLEELARCEAGIKTNGIPAYLLEETDSLLVDYVKLRRKHFHVLFRQAASLFVFQAMCSAGVLGFGGYLVVHREMTMGQLVASLLIVNMVLPALERLVRNMQNVYELLSALGKIGYVEDLPLERKGGEVLPRSSQGARVDIRGLKFSYDEKNEVLQGLDLSLRAGERISLFGPNGSGKTTLAEILCGLLDPATGMVQINGIDVRDLDLDSLRKVVTLMGDSNEIFPASIIENVTLGRSDVTHLDTLWALDIVKFEDELNFLSNGLQTELTTGGRNLSRGQVQKLLLARAIVKRPQLLILDEAFTAIEERTKLEILDRIYSKDLPWTIIDISHDADSIMRSDRIVVLSQGKIVESGTAEELIQRVNGRLEHLFPQLVQVLRIVNRNGFDRSK
jgi:ATP-binding cassette subfamily B protein